MQEVKQARMQVSNTSSGDFARDLQNWAKLFSDQGKKIVSVLPPVEIDSQGCGNYFFLVEHIKK